ncbi:MAG: DEAD/DEAH box helicase [Betaproteobacteria bacterium]|nr:MAG: DEAD/DEAH box helicase [Betaproteobacteria bacterium]
MTQNDRIAFLEAECAKLRSENDKLRAIVERREVRDATLAPADGAVSTTADASVRYDSPTAEKVTLFRSLFRGREDIYPIRWESKSGRTGYSPACNNEWVAGICEKPRVKCTDCPNQAFQPVSDDAVYEHLSGRRILGVYPLLPDDTTRFIAADFDGSTWRDDAIAYAASCRDLSIPAYVEVSRSGDGAHVWTFFDSPIAASQARQLASAAITRACARHRTLAFTSYDRLFPSQDTVPKGGFGNLIALPLQRKARDRGASVFVDDGWRPFPDQWAFLASVERMPLLAVNAVLTRAAREDGVLGVRSVSFDEDAIDDPWTLPPSRRQSESRIAGPMPHKVKVVSANMLFIAKEGLPDALINRLLRLAAFQNPEFYEAQSLRLSTFGKPRIIGCAEDFPNHLALPRGCADELRDLLRDCGIELDVEDKCHDGNPIDASFHGVLRPEQGQAVDAVLAHRIGVLCAPTAFGKTVIAAALIAARKTNTLIIVHRTQLLDQWRNRLSAFLEIDDRSIGVIGAGKRSPTGTIDIGVMQSLVRKGAVRDVVANYGQVIVDECHHVSAFSFERVMKEVKARFVLGLTATPVRRDGHHPIIFMQCGPIRFRGSTTHAMTQRRHVVIPRRTGFSAEIAANGIQWLFRSLGQSNDRNALIVRDIRSALDEGRNPLVLTERKDHLDQLADILQGTAAAEVIVLSGGMGRRRQAAAFGRLEEPSAKHRRIVLATGRFIGEGFDDPWLDTLFLAMPISWRGTLQQYAGRLHREHADKHEVRIYDYVDADVPALQRMFSKRLRGYRAMGYMIAADAEDTTTSDLPMPYGSKSLASSLAGVADP